MKLETTNEELLGEIMVNQTFPDVWLLLFHSPLVIWAAYHLHPGKTLIRNKKKNSWITDKAIFSEGSSCS